MRSFGGVVCPRCGSTDVFVTCVHCNLQDAQELRRSLNLPEPSLSPYKVKDREQSVMEALQKTAAQRDEALAALTAIVRSEHYNDAPDAHWQRNVTVSWCPGCIAAEALASAEKAASSENTGGGS